MSEISSIQNRIQKDLPEAMRARDAQRLSVVRFLKSTIHKESIDRCAPLDDDAVIDIIQKLLQQRRDAMDSFLKAGRAEDAQTEQDEMVILKSYLPDYRADSDWSEAIQDIIQEVGATQLRDLGRLMPLLRARFRSCADLSEILLRVRELLS